MKLSIEKIIQNEDGTKSVILDYDDEMRQLAIDNIAHGGLIPARKSALKVT